LADKFVRYAVHFHCTYFNSGVEDVITGSFDILLIEVLCKEMHQYLETFDA
jgi:hypothetical protein